MCGSATDRKKFLEPNLHVYGKDDTQIMEYNMRRPPRKGGGGEGGTLEKD